MASLGDLVPGAAADRPAKPALIAGDREITYAELSDRVGRAAGALAALGVRKGDRVALLLGNVPEFVEALHGAWRIGAAVAPLNVMLTPEEAASILADAEPAAVVTDPAFLATVLAVEDRVPTGHILVTGDRPAPGNTERWEDALARGGTEVDSDVGEDDLALLQYTAGTTARPKGAMLTHGNLLANLDQMSRVPALQEAESDVVLLALPLFHIYALNVVLGITIREGATAILVDRFDPVATLDLIERRRITVLFGAPPMFTAWLDAAGERPPDLSSVRIAVSGAAPLPGRVLDAFQERFGITIWEGYGLTETGPAVTTNALGDRAKPDSIGLVLPGVEVRLVDEHGDEVADGDPGEIVIRGPNVFRGTGTARRRQRRPSGTAGSHRRRGLPRRGRVPVHRGPDQGPGHRVRVQRVPEGGRGGHRQAPRRWRRSPSSACRTTWMGEAVKALIAAEAGESLTADEILEHCSEALARFKWPKHIEFVDSLPKHVTGKVLRRALRDPDAAAP